MDLYESRPDIRDVLQDLKAGDDVHLAAFKRERLRISQPVVYPKRDLGGMIAGRVKRSRRNIRPEDDGPAPGEILARVPAPAPDVEHFHALPTGNITAEVREAEGVGPFQYGVTPSRRPPQFGIRQHRNLAFLTTGVRANQCLDG